MGTGVPEEMLEIMEGLASSTATAFYMTYSALSSLLSLAVYVIMALSLYTIAKRRFISHAWLAWIPVAQFWIIGGISDHYQFSVHRKVKNKRKVMLWVYIAMIVLALVVSIILVSAIVSLLAAGYHDFSNPSDILPALGSLGGSVIVFLLIGILSIVFVVFYYMALYDLYRSCSPDNAVLFLLVTLFVSISLPIFLLVCRNKDEGMRTYTPPVYNSYNQDPWQV